MSKLVLSLIKFEKPLTVVNNIEMIHHFRIGNIFLSMLYKSFSKIILTFSYRDSSDADLSSSILNSADDNNTYDVNYRDSKKILTVWTTGFTTVTVTTTSYYQGITVSVSLACNPGTAVNSCFG